MNFRKEFEPDKLKKQINLTDKIFFVGSCFTENIYEKFVYHKFSCFQNPHGIIFNPLSVAQAITDCITQKIYTEQDLFYYNELYHSWQHHSQFSSIDKNNTLQKINESIVNGHNFLKSADYICITLGSAWVYFLSSQAQKTNNASFVANNHKAPAQWFNRKLCTVDEVLAALDNMIHRLKMLNADIQFIFTISPVRHLREGFVDNNRSKAILIQAVHQLVNKFDNLYYFPAYELVMDDLRDYRFFAEDMVHPNYLATNYVWEKLKNACINSNTLQVMEQINEINLAYQHKTMNPETNMHKNFLYKYLHLSRQLVSQYPYLDFGKEIDYFSNGK